MHDKTTSAVTAEILLETATFVSSAINAVNLRWDYEISQRSEIIATAFTSACETTSKSVLHLLENGFVFEALIVSRSTMDAAARAWHFLLTDEQEKHRVLAEFDLLLAAELRRKRNVTKSVLDAETGLSFLYKEYAKIISDPGMIGIKALSKNEERKATQAFTFGNLIDGIEKQAKKLRMPVDLKVLRMHYANTSGLSHISPTALMVLERTQETGFIGDGSRSSQTATVCGILILTWYYLQVFWVLPSGKVGVAEKGAYASGVATLRKISKECEAFGNFSAV